ncbi:MAG: YceD family protein [Alphaproteobacteria bacterium]|nr:DUF177 domain-containing protein [Alphaproteobacteria bacterium]MDY4689270.1 YceD family protein [Alphaproteobacteria bacterium]
MQKNFSYPIKIEDLKQSDYKYELTADSAELEDITQILQVEKVHEFKAEIFLKLNNRANNLRVWGNVFAKIELKSVITLDNFIKNYNVPFELNFDTRATYNDIKELECNIEDEVPDIIENGCINLADIAIEQIALNLEDYPRAEGEVFDGALYGDSEEPKKENPFAVLAKLKK